MKELNYKDIKEFLSNKGITLKEQECVFNEPITIVDRIKVLWEFHRLSKGYIFTMNEVIPSFLGKRVENCFADVMRLKKFIIAEDKNTHIDIHERQIIEILKQMINICEKDINSISKDEYRKLVNRSIINMEVCIGKLRNYNIGYVDNIMYINSLEQFNYNLIEEDYINLILSYKKRFKFTDYESIIEYICSLEKLDDSSYRYMKGYIDFPYNFMRNFNRYRIKKNSWSNEEYKNKIIKSIEKDGINILS